MNFKLLLVFAFTLSMYEKVDSKPQSLTSQEWQDLAALEKLGKEVLALLEIKLEDVVNAIPYTLEEIDQYLKDNNFLTHIEAFIKDSGIMDMTAEEIVAEACNNPQWQAALDGVGSQLASHFDFNPADLNFC